MPNLILPRSKAPCAGAPAWHARAPGLLWPWGEARANTCSGCRASRDEHGHKCWHEHIVSPPLGNGQTGAVMVNGRVVHVATLRGFLHRHVHAFGALCKLPAAAQNLISACRAPWQELPGEVAH